MHNLLTRTCTKYFQRLVGDSYFVVMKTKNRKKREKKTNKQTQYRKVTSTLHFNWQINEREQKFFCVCFLLKYYLLSKSLLANHYYIFEFCFLSLSWKIAGKCLWVFSPPRKNKYGHSEYMTYLHIHMHHKISEKHKKNHSQQPERWFDHSRFQFSLVLFHSVSHESR